MRHELGKFTAVNDDRLKLINGQLKGEVLTDSEARTQIDLLVESFYRADGVQVSRVESNSVNSKLVQKFLNEEIADRKTKKTSKASLESYLFRAIGALGEHSIATSDIKVLQGAMDRAYPDQRQRQLVTYLNAVLKWIGRKDKLRPHSKQPREVSYIPLNKLAPIVERLPSRAWQVAVMLASHSGLRIGELFALSGNCRMKAGLRVEWQIERDGTRSRPKRGKRRTVACFQEALDLLNEWLEIKNQISHQERNQAAKIVRAACLAAYPNKSEWNLCFHDLRHSFAVACCDKGMGLDWLAQQLGDRMEVAEEYYVGFIQSEVTQTAAFALLNN